MAKTGSEGGRWVELERPKPPKVDDMYRFWSQPPAHMSEACEYWLRQIQRGWLPNKHLARDGYEGVAQWMGCYLWEYLHVLLPAQAAERDRRRLALLR